MTDAGAEIERDDELGPIDYIVVEFPAREARFTGDAAAELVALVSSGTIRILDLTFLHKAEDGSIEVEEIEDLDSVEELGELGVLEAALAEVLAEQDLLDISAAMGAGEQCGGARVGKRLGRTLRRGAPPHRRPAHRLRPHPVAGADRIDDQRRRMTMPIGIGRVGRVGMIGRPVVRTAAVVGTAKVVSNGVDRRQERRQDRRDRRR
ncbi:hypothetical protein [Microbacterium kunmingense]|uniref:hypothetical protein n=1 Tax=Microbacterium kunmingense TaxID=2915939 RepID=UPI003D763F06